MKWLKGRVGSDTKTALASKTCVLMELKEIVALLERGGELQALRQQKLLAAEADKKTYSRGARMTPMLIRSTFFLPSVFNARPATSTSGSRRRSLA